MSKRSSNPRTARGALLTRLSKGSLAPLVVCAGAASCSADGASAAPTPNLARVAEAIGACATPATTTPPFTNVLDYGAIPNDGLDDTAAITSAILAAAGCGGGTGGTVYFPPGVFQASTLDMNGLGVGAGRRDGIKLLGASGSSPVASGGSGGGTVLQAVAGITGPLIRADAIRVSIENMTLDGFGVANPVLQFWYLSTLGLVKDVTLTGAPANGTLAQFDGSRADPPTCGPEGQCDPPLEADGVLDDVFFAQTGNVAQYDLDVIGSNTFRIIVRNSRFTGANDLVHVFAGGVELQDCDFDPPATANGSIRIDSLVQAMSITNSYTEVAGPAFLYQGSVQEADGMPELRLINNDINAAAPILFVPNQPLVLEGNVFKGNVNINSSGSPAFGNQRVTAVANTFAAGALLAGSALAQVDQIATSQLGATSSTLAALNLTGVTNVSGALGFQNGAQIDYRVVASTLNQDYAPPREVSPLNFDEIHAGAMLEPATWAVDDTGVAAGARLRFVKTTADYPITISQDNHDGTYTPLTAINGVAGANGWVEVVLMPGTPNYWSLSAWGKN